MAKNNLLFIVEMGVDPGIDLMQAKEIIDNCHAKGEVVESFFSACGGLTSPKCLTDTCIPYKPSWTLYGSLKPVLYDSIFIEDGEEKFLKCKDLLTSYTDHYLGIKEIEDYKLVS